MNNYCIYLKKRKGQPFCKLLNKEINFPNFSECRNCDNKEYKTKKADNSFYKSNNNQIKRSLVYKKKKPVKIKTIKNKSNKLAKAERNRYSVFTTSDRCFVCGGKYNLTWNEIFRGRNRINSMKYGFCLRMCLECHRRLQEDTDFNDFWHKKAQLYFEENIGSRNEFMTIFRKNYLDK